MISCFWETLAVDPLMECQNRHNFLQNTSWLKYDMQFGMLTIMDGGSE